MRHNFIIILCWITLPSAFIQEPAARSLTIGEPVRFLALGDSYTIGTGVTELERWPVQLKDSLKARGYDFESLRIVARQGWRTDGLINALNSDPPETDYTLVSLLIGVNNQFSGGSLSTYETEFSQLLDMAVQYAGGDPGQVLVLSIPDYAFTPYGQSSGPGAISRGIDDFNQVNGQIARSRDILYVNITDISRRGLMEPALVADDGLHPSGLQYSLWISRILDDIPSRTLATGPAPEALPVTGEMQIRQVPGGNAIRVSLPTAEGLPFMVSMFSMNGRRVGEFRVDPGSDGIMDIGGLPPGLYILLAQQGPQTFHAKFVRH